MPICSFERVAGTPSFGAPRWRRVALAVALALGLAGRISLAGAASEPVELTILHLNDSHGCLRPGSAPDAPPEAGSLTQAATLIRRLRNAATGPVMLLHAGDVLSRGGPATIHHGGAADFAALAAMGLDALTPGNGDFYFGPDNLVAQSSRAGLPVVLANVVWKDSGAALFPSSRVITSGPVRVGIVGAGFIHVKHYAAENLTLRNAMEAARAESARLRPVTDAVILLSHLGHKADRALAESAPDLDLIVGGHSHTVLNEPDRIARPGGAGECVIVQAGDLCRFVGEVRLRLEPGPIGYRPIVLAARLHAVAADLAEDPAVVVALHPYEPALKKVVGILEMPHKRKEVARMAGDAMRRATGTRVALLEKDTIQAGLPGGEVTEADICRAHPWRQPVMTIAITPEILTRLRADRDVVVVGDGDAADPGRVAVDAFLASEHPALRGRPREPAGWRLDDLLRLTLANPAPQPGEAVISGPVP